MSDSEKKSYRFKSFALNVIERQLLVDGKGVPLTPKAFDTLVYLVERAGHLVEKDELMELIWCDSFVEENNLARIIHDLRRALGQDKNGNRFIETVPKKGYRFVAEVSRVVETGSLSEAQSIGYGAFGGERPDTLGEALRNLSAKPARAASVETEMHSPRFLWIAAGLLIAVALGAIISLDWKPAPGPEGTASIAVLPLRSLDNDERGADYELAIADSIVSQLGSTGELKVKPLSSTWQYLHSDKDAVATGRELNVDYVLAATYQIVDGNVRVNAQLVNSKTGIVETSFKSEREITGAFQTQDMIAADLGSAIVRRFGMRVSDGVRRRGTASYEAYQYVLQAAYTLDNLRMNGTAKSLELSDKAIALDPDYARAYAVRAYAYRTAAWKPEKIGLSVDECYLKSKEAVETALRLDPNVSDAYAMLGEIKHTYEWKSDEADAAYRRAIEIDPNNAHARRYYALFLMSGQRFDEAIKQMKVAIDIEPASIFGHRNLGLIYSRAGRYDDSIEQLKRVREMDPQVHDVSGILWQTYYLKGDWGSAYTEFKAQFSRDPKNSERLARLDAAYSASGWNGVFRAEADVFEQRGDLLRAEDAVLGPVLFYTALGDHDKALTALENQAKGRNRSAVVFPGRWLDPLRPTPRFQALMQKLGY